MTKKSGLADSPFFRQQQAEPVANVESVAPPQPLEPKKKKIARKTKTTKKEKSDRGGIVIPRHQDTKHGIKRDTMPPRYHDTIVETVRRAVREFGKEAATHRFTQGEKKALADLIYTYKQRGTKTSENEITRIAINYLISDYQENGENSILHKVLEALNT